MTLNRSNQSNIYFIFKLKLAKTIRLLEICIMAPRCNEISEMEIFAGNSWPAIFFMRSVEESIKKHCISTISFGHDVCK